MSAIVDTNGLAHLVAVIERCRPTWDTPGIRRHLELALSRHTYGHVARIAIGSALDPTANTPAVIPARCTNGWTGPDAQPATATPPATPTCRRCGAIATEPNHDEHCGRRAEPGARQRAYAELEETP